MNCDQLLSRTLALDLEVTKTGEKLRHLGAVFGGRTFEWSGREPPRKALAELDALARQAQYALGHNILGHDLPFLKSLYPNLALYQLPIIDTLYLSPLAFPQNPYHRLVKNYKLARSSISDPIEDVRLALSVFKDQWESFQKQFENSPELLSFYRACFQESRFGPFSGQGIAEVFGLMGAGGVENANQARDIFQKLTQSLVCDQVVARTVNEVLGKPEVGPVAAYGLAWLLVAGSNSVLPPWVRHQFADVVPFLKKLRDIPCGDHKCAYCSSTHNPDLQLKRFFGFEAFRKTPKGVDGDSLQREIALDGMQDAPLLAILPTGGGKSLCFQLPALVRHMRRGLLTVVFSPLQALMKDQVDNLVKNTGTPFAGAIYGMLTPPERGEVLERARMGDLAILYISPEQLRSRSVREVLRQREIGCWVFDEAHCLSKWGHDFRPDYLYAARFIREFAQEQKLPQPPIACFTATAKIDVIHEIRAYFSTELQQTLRLYPGGVERENLSFEVYPVTVAEKLERTFELVQRYTDGETPASAIVYAATKKKTEEISSYLLNKGLLAAHFHAGLEPSDKRRIIEDFVAGEITVICATNAFGMGIDKENIRLVLHYDIPGSLENYLQEAGRAGRDRSPATCILLYDPKDAEQQFMLGAMSQVKKDDIARILRSLRRSKRNRDNDIVITTQELMRDEELLGVFERNERSSDTKVRTAVSWLERAGFLERNENMTQVFQGKPLVKSIEQAEPVIQRAKLNPLMEHLWRGILQVLFNEDLSLGLSADGIAESLYSSAALLNQMQKQFGLTPAQAVIHAMHDMAAAGLIDKGLMLSAVVRTKGKKSAKRLLDTACHTEERLLKLLQEEDPDADDGHWVEMDVSCVNQRLRNSGDDSNPVVVRNLVKGLSLDGLGLAGSHGSIELRHLGRDRYQIRLQRSWKALSETAALRRNVAHVIVRELIQKIQTLSTETGDGGDGDALVPFSANDLAAAIEADLLLHGKLQKPLAAIDRSLMFLHENNVIRLQQGLAVFRQAMTIRLSQGAKGRRYTLGDYNPLSVHYRERLFQVHVMMEYAQLAVGKVAQALRLVLDYFTLPRDVFAREYFAGREDVIERATSAEFYRQIVESLNNPIQIKIVGSPVQSNSLILAGPGSGKTRVVVHRCAYLLRVERVPACRILVMCFNHSAAVALRKRLHQLVGQEARGVLVATYHGAAMRLAGISLRELSEGRAVGSIDFDGLIRDAVALFKGEKEVAGLEPDEARDQLLGGFSHILVDEYQDIDQDQYELVSAIAGRKLADEDGKLAIMAVGDDDQNVYAFRGANVQFIKQFEKDYGARTVYMVENYRSSGHIIAAANQLITQNKDRMKGEHPIRVNTHRKVEPSGGAWEMLDPLGQGRVQRLLAGDIKHQAWVVLNELERLRGIRPAIDWGDCAVLARTNQTLAPVRALLEQQGVPFKRNLETGLPLHRVREIGRAITELKGVAKEIRSASQLADLLPKDGDGGAANPWVAMLSRVHGQYQVVTADAQLPVDYFIDWLYEALVEQRQEKTLGTGVFLNTIHSAKGMEFDHVFILDGDWKMPMELKDREEERRALYVGMTRAKETLCLLELEKNGNPFVQRIVGGHVFRRRGAGIDENTADPLGRAYCLIGLKDMYLSYAGRFGPNHTIHRHLAALDLGHKVTLTANGTGIDVCNDKGVCVAKLSREGSQAWIERLDSIVETRIIGLMQWNADDAEAGFRNMVNTESWELPLLEVVTAPS